VDVEWCRDRLQQYLQAVRAYEKSTRGYGKEWRETQQRYPTVRAILRSLDSESQKFDLESQEFDPDDDPESIKTVVLRGLGILEDQAVLSSKLPPDAPVLAADRMHPWVWELARPMWKIQQFRQTLLVAATAINAQLQAKRSGGPGESHPRAPTDPGVT